MDEIDRIIKEMEEEAENREYIENHLMVDVDWSSTGLWVKIKDDGFANTQYEYYDLPQWLLDRFNYWTELFNSQEPTTIEEDLDWDSFNAYGLSLAIDLKRVLGDGYRIFYGYDKEIILQSGSD